MEKNILAENEAQVWCASLEKPADIVAGFSALLSPDEQARAARFHFERHRNHFIVGRGLLRTIIGSYLGVEPEQIEFSYGPQGKPALMKVAPGKNLQFNVSHSEDQAVYIFSWNRLVGIDIEFKREMPDQDDFAKKFFSPAESALIASLAGDQKRNAFFKLWTCKEAILKASGDGLTKPIEAAEISILDGGQAVKLAAIDGDRQQASGWHLELFEPVVSYQAALAIEGHDCQIVFRQGLI